MTLVVLALVAGFLLGCAHSLTCWWLAKGGMNPNVIAVLAVAGPIIAVFLGWASA